MNLSTNQQNVMDDINNAPDILDTSNMETWDDWISPYNDNGVVFGVWNTITLKSLVKKGLIQVIEFGGFWQDQIIIM